MRMRSVRSLLAGAVALLLTGSAHMGATLAATSAEERVRAQAEAMADAASKEFNAYLERQNLAQANPQKPAGVIVKTEEREPGLLGWFRQSGFSFQNLMRKLAGEQATPPAWDPVADARTRMPADQQQQTASAATAVTAPTTKPLADAPPKAAETKPAVADKREPDARTAKPPQKTDPAKPAESKPAEAKPQSDAARPDIKQAAKPAETTPTKGTDTAKAPAKDAASPKPPVVADAKPAVSPKPSEVKAPAAAPAPAPPAKAETPKAPAVAKAPEPPAKQTEPAKQPDAGSTAAASKPAPVPAGKTAMVTAPPATPDAKPQAGKSKPRARASLPPVAACRGAGTLSNGWYTVRQGDSLWRIAERHLGSGTRYRVVQAANRRGIADAGLIRACQRIYIPGHGGRRRG
jgi:hypothetical protein